MVGLLTSVGPILSLSEAHMRKTVLYTLVAVVAYSGVLFCAVNSGNTARYYDFRAAGTR